MPPAMEPNLPGHRFAMKPSTTMVATDVIHPSVRARAWHGASDAVCLSMRTHYQCWQNGRGDGRRGSCQVSCKGLGAKVLQRSCKGLGATASVMGKNG